MKCQKENASECGRLFRRDEDVVFQYGNAEYTLGSHPYEPCLYIKKDGRTLRTLHNAFDAYELPERFAAGEILTGIDGRKYDSDAFCKVLAAAIDSDRSEMDFPFAAGLAETAGGLQKNPCIRHGMGFYKAEALRIIKEQYPEADESCITDRYEIGYWNDRESFIDKLASVEYPGTAFPGPISASEDEMIEILVKSGIENLEKK